ncbi:hypothetical protein OHD16_01065 [Sphingobacterium sp. ML3W]|uniref:hypothetical protein n=1 Tax=Sphingobacterium sp. ML3W TaxID=1538644 RepID=UPI00249C0228|nr:hypothetical protein [Sphingobacterium sp. ML3W]WFA78578.1 hypothetical protein OGI71_21345 [Sphingobacterium sp. ML3W]
MLLHTQTVSTPKDLPRIIKLTASPNKVNDYSTFFADIDPLWGVLLARLKETGQLILLINIL